MSIVFSVIKTFSEAELNGCWLPWVSLCCVHLFNTVVLFTLSSFHLRFACQRRWWKKTDFFFLTWPYLYDWISNHQRPYINTRNFIFQHCLDWSHAQGVTAWITYVQKNQHKLANLLVLYSEVSSLDFRNYCPLYIAWHLQWDHTKLYESMTEFTPFDKQENSINGFEML